MRRTDMSQRRNLVLFSVCIALVQVALYYFVSATVRSDGTLAVAQPDTLLYCQAARRIAEGFPFSFSAGTAVSTGTTSVLYPFLLAPLYLIGFTGTSLLAAGFALNAALYVLFVVGWGLTACRVFDGRPMSRMTSVLLVSLFGPFAYCALAQSDIGLWMAVSAWLVYGLATGRRGLYVPLLLLAPWVRPEGAVVVLCFSAFALYDSLRSHRMTSDAVAAFFATASVAGVFLLNYALTGSFQFSSVAQKGYFKTLSPFSAVYMTAVDFMHIAKAYLLGIPQYAPRDFFYLPGVGAAFVWIGIFARPWRAASWRELAWHLAVLGGFLTVAASGWQNTNLDRYLVWTMPAFLFFMAYGADVVSSKIGGRVRMLPGAVVVAFTGAMAVVMVFLFGFSASAVDSMRRFAVRCDAVMPKGASFATWGNCGVAYDMSDRRTAHLSGIYSPEFLLPGAPCAQFETLKNRPETRFGYWLCLAADKERHHCERPEIVLGREALAAPPDCELRVADWSAYDAAASVPSALPGGPTLRSRVDVVYDCDERDSMYEPLTRDDYPFFAPFFRAGDLAGTNIVEAGRFLLGGDSMTVPLVPGRDVDVVMRTALGCTASVDREVGRRASKISLKSPLELRVLVDGVDAGTVSVDVAEGDFCDAHFTIPGNFLTTPNPRLTFLGEHVAFAYWFYQ